MFLRRRGETPKFSISNRLKKRTFLSFGYFSNPKIKKVLFGTAIAVLFLSAGVFGFSYFKHSKAANIPLYCQVNPATQITECLMQYDTGTNEIYLNDTDTRINNQSNPVDLKIIGSSTGQTLTVIVSGTFWFDVLDTFGVVHQIREGRFDMQYTN